MPCLYSVGQEIEYSNGITAKVVWVDDEEWEGGNHFIIENADGTFSACHGFMQDDEEVWYYVFEEDTDRNTFSEALQDISASIVIHEGGTP